MSLSKIEKVDLRDGWPNEAQDFTPWLANHISQLGEALDIELESEDTEVAVGSYWLDILAKDSVGNPVIIENQLGITDHDHLGKLMTYAAGREAKTAVWIAKEFREEHRQALDWLNQQTTTETKYFGVVVELWKIDSSRPAPHFRLVAAPNEWSKRLRETTRGGSAKGELYRGFFQSLIDTLRESHKFTQSRKASDKSWCNFSTGYRGIVYGAAFGHRRTARVELYIDVGDGERNLEILDYLEQRMGEGESHFDQPLDWQRLEDSKACRVAIIRSGAIDEGENTLNEVRNWMIDNLIKFRSAFAPLLSEQP